MTPVRPRPHRRAPVLRAERRRPADRAFSRPADDPLAHQPVADAARAITHEDLLVLARSVQTAAIADDAAQLAVAVRSLQAGLRRHLASEQARRDHLPPALRAVVLGGQDRLVRIVDTISGHAGRDHECACVRLGAELVVALQRQAALEAATQVHPTVTRTT